MHCEACSALIKDISSEFPDIKNIDVDLQTKNVTLDHDESFNFQQWKNDVESIDQKYAIITR